MYKSSHGEISSNEMKMTDNSNYFNNEADGNNYDDEDQIIILNVDIPSLKN